MLVVIRFDLFRDFFGGFYRSGHLIEAFHDCVVGLFGYLGKFSAPGLFRLLVALLECLAHGLNLIGVSAGQGVCKIKDSLGGLLYAPVAILGDILLCL